MKTSLGLCLFLGAVAPMFAAVGVGDSYDQVIAEKGAPSGKMQAGPTLILRYADQTIKLKDGRVVAVEAIVERAPSVLSDEPAAPARPMLSLCRLAAGA